VLTKSFKAIATNPPDQDDIKERVEENNAGAFFPREQVYKVLSLVGFRVSAAGKNKGRYYDGGSSLVLLTI
jgi:hypothetical protein